MNFLEIEKEWNATVDSLKKFSEITSDQYKKNKAISAIEIAETYRKCSRMIDGLNWMFDVKYSLGLQ